jgi:uncharacterized protein YyaL (SSP411 family)
VKNGNKSPHDFGFQATQGGGGWPLNVFLTPDLKPITGGTYVKSVSLKNPKILPKN